MKKLIAIMLSCIMILLVLSSCNLVETPTEDTTSAPQITETEKEETSALDTDISSDSTDTEPEATSSTETTTVKEPILTEASSEDASSEDASSEEPSSEETSEDTSIEESSAEETSEEPSSEETSEETSAEETTKKEPTYYIEGLDVSSSKLQGDMVDVLHSGQMVDETIFLFDTDLDGAPKTLLLPIKEIISVTNYAGTKTYTEGVDYQLVDGKIQFLSTTKIRVMTESKYYGVSDAMLQTTKPDGTVSNTYWGEGTTMTMSQLRITYTYDSSWKGFEQKSNIQTYENVIKKLIAGEDVTFIFYGDSITCGATSSWFVDTAPYKYSYSMLFTEAIADLFGYTVNYVNVSHLQSGMIKPTPNNYVAGTRGTINFINPSVGGWNTAQGLSNFDTFVKPYIQQYGCDLFSVAFGMNDGGTPVDNMVNSVKGIINKVTALSNDAHIAIVSTMVPNNIATNGWYGNQDKQEAALLELAATLSANGTKTAVTQMTSMSLSVLEYKAFVDYTGNNINHPNDFFNKIYAQTLFQSFIGYEYLA